MTGQRTLLLIVSSAMVLILANCDANLLDSHSVDAIGMTASSGTSVAFRDAPLRGRCETTFIPHPDQPAPPLVRQIDEGSCNLSHLGKTSFYSVKDINFATGTQITTEAQFTAANGDVLRAIGSGTSGPVAPGTIGFTATLTFTGGTGRFERATGEMNVAGQATLATRVAEFEIVGGHIGFHASDRGGR